ncbi:MAG TPA: chemotaxis protein CheD [Verrucomicrobia bacterium]|nr:MAG: chemotaxis protein CheD [Lentisphaerae bacterium GWF2_57_35]HBA84078.1 chemotaxis protein CheD [Verrucomicrobiota bacterium]
MNNVIVGISEMAVSNTADDVLTTYSLGSCLGITFYDTSLHVGGMIHCMLPLSQIDAQKALENPCMFVDTGTTKLLKEMFALGCRKSSLVVKIAGASAVLDSKGLFKIGERNYTIFRKILWKNSMLIHAEDVGGNISRTVRLEIATGRVTIKSGGVEKEL